MAILCGRKSCHAGACKGNDLRSDYQKSSDEQQTRREDIWAKRDIAIKAIDAQKELILKYFEYRFTERSEVLGQFFELLEKAVAQKNEKMMDVALTGVVQIVKNNPLSDFESFRKSMSEGLIIEI